MADAPSTESAPERAELTAPRRGRPPSDKLKPSDLIGKKEVNAMADIGAAQLVRFLWMLSRFGAWIAGGTLDGPLSEEESTEGREEAKAILLRFQGLNTILAFIGLPMWLSGKIAERFRKREKKETPALQGEGSNVLPMKADDTPRSAS